MSNRKITVLQDIAGKLGSTEQELFVTFNELRRWALSGNLLRHLFRYQEVRLITYSAAVIQRPFLTALVLKLLSRGSCFIEGINGDRQPVTFREIARLFSRFVKDLIDKQKVTEGVRYELAELEMNVQRHFSSGAFIASGQSAYLRTDLWFGVSSGGSVGHIAGVLNNLDQITGKPIFITSDSIPTVREDIETHTIAPEKRFWDFLELPGLFYNTTFYQESQKILKGKNISFIYQRYSLNNYTGLKLAQHYGIPFVLEYNGSEIWVARHWGEPLKYEALAEQIEVLNLKIADVIIVVSGPLRVELIKRGIDSKKILVNPNGVDPDRYFPDIDGSSVRMQHDLNNKTVIGFIGSFGPWHGAEVLAEAFGRLLKEYPEYRESLRLLMIGDGVTMPLVKEMLAQNAVGDAAILTGRIPQEEGPSHLAACDILASPHVPNQDGTPFFGSPTKLFEYMAMGRGIVASDLDQIGEILKHEKTALMVKPGDAGSLMLGLKRLIDNKDLRERLGKTAREEVVAKYTWKEHTRKTIDKLRSVLQQP